MCWPSCRLRSEPGTRFPPRWPGTAVRMVTFRNELSLALVRHGYDALARLREAGGGADWFSARLLGRRALVVRGPLGVRTFYDPDLVTRSGAVPAPLRLLLFGPGTVHGLDGLPHLERKELFFRIVDAESVRRLADLVDRRLGEASSAWGGSEIRLFDELTAVYGEAVIEWSGIETEPGEDRRIARELALIVDGFGVRGTAYPRAVLGRVRAQLWARRIVREARAGERVPPPGTALEVVAASALSDTVAATELVNVLRPTVAVAFFGAFAGHALAAHAEWRSRLADGTDDERRAFEHEIRRWYPFAPLLPGRLRRDVHWAGGTARAKEWIVLDIAGTNRDPAVWRDPDHFEPERFLDDIGRVVEPDVHRYVPHGGGDVRKGHRCPGEPSAAALLEVTLRRLASLDLELGPGAHEIPLRRIPSRAPAGTRVAARAAR